MKRLYDSSLGRLEVELNLPIGEVSVWLFDGEGRVVREGGDEWDYADLPDLLQVEMGLPEPEAQSISTRFLDAAKTEGHEQPPPTSPIGTSVAVTVLTGILVALGVGVWTIVTSITVEILGVILLLLVIWLLPAILFLRWWDRRRGRGRPA